jgi:DNA polymerase (family 10)
VKRGEDLTELEEIGESVAQKIVEIVETGELEHLQAIAQRTPPELAKMLDISGLGPKRVQTIHEALAVSDLNELEAAARAHEIQELEGLGAKTEQQIIDDLENTRDLDERTRLDVARQVARPLVAYLREIEGVSQVRVASSYRRWQELEDARSRDVPVLDESEFKALVRERADSSE